VDTLIGDIVPPESLMKTLTDRKLAEEQKVTYDTQKKAQETRQGMEKETAIAEMQKEIVRAQQSVEISERTANATVKKAEGDATAVKLSAGAEAEALKLRATGEAEAIRLKASANAEQISLTGNAEAGKILAIGKSNAEAYELAVKALGGDNFTRYKITEELSKGHIKLIPDVLIGGNGNGNAMEGLLGLKLMEMMDPEKNKNLPKKDDGKKEPPKIS
jgi:regulator of protease activity HflC (stomatin/prohibitin superfamily)